MKNIKFQLDKNTASQHSIGDLRIDKMVVLPSVSNRYWQPC